MSRQRPLVSNEPSQIQTPPEAAAAASAFRPYSSPRILFRQPLEAVAAICSGPGRKTIGICIVSSS